MKTKLTLTVEKKVIDKARRRAKMTGKSISRLFEDFIEESSTKGNSVILTESQKAAMRLLDELKIASASKVLDDKLLRRSHVERKYS